MATPLALATPCSEPCGLALALARGSPPRSFCQELSSRGGAGLGGHISVVLSFLGAGPGKTGWGEGVCFSSGWGAAASNAFGVSACQEEGDALNRLWTSLGLRKECWAWTPTAGFEGSLGHLLVWKPG